MPALWLDNAAVFNVGGDQKDITIGAGLDKALVADSTGPFSFKLVIPRQEVCIAYVQGRGNQPGGINHRVRAKHDAIGVDHKHPAIGEQLTQNIRRRLAHHTVQHGATAACQNRKKEYWS